MLSGEDEALLLEVLTGLQLYAQKHKMTPELKTGEALEANFTTRR
jgi:hypothetical protein